MNQNDLKSMWNNLHVHCEEDFDYNINMEEIMRVKHSKVISKILFDQKLKVILFGVFFLGYMALMTYGFLYLAIHLSISAIIPLVVAGSYILFKTTSEIVRYIVLIKSADDMPLKESFLLFRKKLNRIKNIDLVSNLIFFYGSIFGLCYILSKDPLDFSYLLRGSVMPFFILLVLFLLSIPWLIRYQHDQRYKRLYSNLKHAINFLTDEAQ